jgi:hypothetical protein
MTQRDITVNETSKIIKKTLTAAFPGVKFSVRLEKYSGGCSIDASWIDGPATVQVNAILERFSGTGFDGMTDCSFHCGERRYKGELVDFHSGYVRASRQDSPGLLRAVTEKVAKDAGVPVPMVNAQGYLEGAGQAVHYAWHPHWIPGQGEILTVKDLLSKKPILAHDSNGTEFLSHLIYSIAARVSLKPHMEPVELPEYINIEENASTGRASFEEPMKKFEGTVALDAERKREAESTAAETADTAATLELEGTLTIGMLRLQAERDLLLAENLRLRHAGAHKVTPPVNFVPGSETIN